MDIATIGIISGMITLPFTIMLTIVIYLDRSRRSEMMVSFSAVDRRFEQVDKRFEQVDRRFEQVDKRFDQVDKRFDRLEKQNNELTRIIVAMAKDVGEIKGRLGISAPPVEVFSAVD